MLKKTITYTDYNGMTRTEDFYFNLSMAEVAEMEMSTAGGLAEMIQRVAQSQDGPNIIKIFKDLVLKAYGEKSPDGKHFVKSPEKATLFSQTEAYTDAEAAAAFVNGIFPADLVKKMAAQGPAA